MEMNVNRPFIDDSHRCYSSTADARFRTKLSKLLRDGDAALAGRRLHFWNTPGQWKAADVHALFSCKLGQLGAQGRRCVNVNKLSWTVTFERALEALDCAQLLDGYPINGRRLRVFYAQGAEEEEADGHDEDDKGDRCVDQTLAEFVRCTAAFLHDAGPPMALTDRRLLRRIGRAPIAIQRLIAEWPVGFFRSCRQMGVTGDGRLRAVGQHPMAPLKPMNKTNLRPSATTEIYKERWEPMAPADVRDQDDFVRYMLALLRRFGPLWVGGDVRLQWACAALPARWSALSPAALARLLVSATSMAVLVGDTLYALHRPTHRQLLAFAVSNRRHRP